VTHGDYLKLRPKGKKHTVTFASVKIIEFRKRQCALISAGSADMQETKFLM
jgi:hypothetical protein